LNTSAFTRYMLEPEPLRKPIAPILPNTRLERTNQLSLLPDKDLVDLCPPIKPYQVTKSHPKASPANLELGNLTSEMGFPPLATFGTGCEE